jgi:hypothetical protein
MVFCSMETPALASMESGDPVMKKILLSLAAIGVVAAAAAPAAAQPWRDYGADAGRYDAGRYDAGRNDGRGYEAERYGGYQQPFRDGRLTTAYVDSLDWKIRAAARDGRISWDEARDLRGQARAIQPIAWRVQNGQANRWEADRLERTVDRIEYAVSRGEYGWRR